MSNEAESSSSSVARGPNEAAPAQQAAQAPSSKAAAPSPASPSTASSSSSSSAAAAAPSRPDDHGAHHHHALNSINLSLLDPARWGWTAAGGIADLLPPHERARRREAKRTFLLARQRSEGGGEPGRGHGSRSMGGESRSSHAARSLWMHEGRGAQAPPEPPAAAASSLSHVAGAASTSKKPPGGAAGKKRKGAAAAREPCLRSKAGMKPVRFSALWGDSVLDMYTYHRGREGVELRDTGTGDLLCDVEATDTSHGTEAPHLVAPVTVEFVLDDADGPGGQVTRKFRQLVNWDLGDPSTAPPIVFATDIAEQFGLSYRQTLDLSESIEGQLNAWVRKHCGHSQPLVLKDAAGLNRDPPASTIYALYGGVVGSSEGGTSLPALPEKKKASAKQSTRAAQPRPTGPMALTAPESSRGGGDDSARGKGKATGLSKRRKTSFTAVEEEYVLEVRRRLREESSARIQSVQSLDQPEADQATRDVQCHICQTPVEARVAFACTYDHAFCDAHPPELLQGARPSDATAPEVPPHCPVCALSCTCETCARRLTAVACLLKTKCADQEVGATEAIFENLLEATRDIEVATNGPTRPSGKRKNFESAAIRVVPKVPPSEFPREVCNGVDLDPGTESDYLAVYSAKGATVPPGFTISEPSIGQDALTPTAPPQEDGSIDYCIECGKHGHLLCCDFCPRAFHSSCVGIDGVDDQSDSPWQCPSCKKEQLGLPEETLDGSKVLERITREYQSRSGNEELSEEDPTKLNSIAILREMLDFLRNFSFGYAFKDPVDPDVVPAYRTIIKKPMDLGTIALKIDDGDYFRKLSDGGLEDAVSAIVQDVELVWRNCFTFNFPGSAIYRMAEVQRKASLRILANSLDEMTFQKLRGDFDAIAPSASRSERPQTDAEYSEPAASSKERFQSTQKGRHKISVPTKGAQNRRSIAVLDPDTRRVVKIYSSLQAACATIEFFLGLKYECERDFEGQDIYPKLRLFVKDAAKDASFLLFGYRWLWLNDLRNRKVSFKKAGVNVHCNSGEPQIRVPNGDNPKTATEEVTSKSRPPKESPSSVRGSSDLAENDGFVTEVWAVTRNDAVSGEVLADFKSVAEAYKDWLTELEGSTAIASDTQTLQDFTSLYLDRDKPVAGAVWKSNNFRRVTNVPKRLPRESVEYLKAWMASSEHVDHPYPTDEEKDEIMAATGLEYKQITNWFGNQRSRHWKAGRPVNGIAIAGVRSAGSARTSPPNDDGANPTLTPSSKASSQNDPRTSPATNLFQPLPAKEIDAYEVVRVPESHHEPP